MINLFNIASPSGLLCHLLNAFPYAISLEIKSETPAQKIKRLEKQLEDERLKNSIMNSMIDVFDKQYGARPLNRAIQKYIEDALAEEIINSGLQEGDSILMDLNEKSNELTIKIKKQKKTTES